MKEFIRMKKASDYVSESKFLRLVHQLTARMNNVFINAGQWQTQILK